MSERSLENQDANLIAGRFRTVSLLGEGAMGQVHRCIDTKLGKTVAVKLLRQDAPNLSINRFLVEAKALANANHPNILRIFDFGQAEDSRLYLVMEYIEGESLAKFIDQNGSMPLTDALPLLLQICQGLYYAHSRQILHRDIQPNNVMMVPTKGGGFDVKLVDFGLAKLTNKDQFLTRTGTALGTPPYMSPETVQGKELDERSDIYSLGCLMFEVLTGHLPFLGPTHRDTMFMHLDAPVPSLVDMSEHVIPKDLENIVHRCLEKNPDDRYQSANDLVQDIERVYNTILMSGDYTALSLEGESPDKSEPPQKVAASAPLAASLWKRIEPYMVASSTLLLLSGVLVISLNLSGTNRGKTAGLEKSKQSEAKQNGSRQLQTPSKDPIEKGSSQYASQTLKPQASASYDYSFRQPFCQISGDVSEKQLEEASNKFRQMKIFRFYRAPLRGKGLEHFARLPLEELSIEQTPLSESDFQTLAKFKSLKRLRLLNSSPISRSSIERLLYLKHLQLLEIKCPDEHDGHFEAISKLKDLETLILRQYKLDQSALVALQRNQFLTTLSLQECAASPDAIGELKHLKKLERLEFVDMPLSVRDIEQIVLLPLGALQIAGDKVSDYSLRQLSHMTLLKELDLAGSSINEPTIAYLKDALPHVKIRVGNLR